MSLKPLWGLHPHVRSGSELTTGERAADVLKRAFGSWMFLFILNAFIVVWAVANWVGIVHFDAYPFIALNLVLSWLASQQGGALQIAANRGDRIASELAQHTFENGQKILAINNQQLEILEELRALNERLDATDEPVDTPPPDEGRSGFFAP